MFLFKITFRILIFNVLLVFLPVAFLFYIDTYEKKLLIAQEHAMVQQGRIAASSLSNRGDELGAESKNLIDILKNRQEARIRIIDTTGKILADSSNIIIPETSNSRKLISYSSNFYLSESNDNKFLYRIIRVSLDFIRYFLNGPNLGDNYEYYGDKSILDGVEIQAALNGKYGSTTRISKGGQRSVTLYSAIPIYNYDIVCGVVLVSQSTYRILQDLYQIRLEILKIFLISLCAAIIISLFMSRTIATPIKKLRNEAKEITDCHGRIQTSFKSSKRPDEIGDLNRSLEELTTRLKSHLEKTENFASDISHEFKNPLASIRSATEILSLNSSDQDKKFLTIITQEIQRLERLIAGVREITLIDAGINNDNKEVIDTYNIIETILSRFKINYSDKNLQFKLIGNNKPITICPNRFIQVIENILSNAVSFSKNNSEITVKIDKVNNKTVVSISDQGPGIPQENIDKVFNRFFTYREDSELLDRNSGLGLSISKSIIESYGGKITIENNKDLGVTVKLVFN